MSIERAAKATVSPSQSRSIARYRIPVETSRESARAISRRLARWYRAHGRTLPWRRTRDPYAIWLSEVMAQQTAIDVVVPRWKRFLSRFPTVAALARAPERAVL